MRKLEGELVLMRIFIGESDRGEHRPLHVALLEPFRSRGLAGATILRGVTGFGPNSVVHTPSILRLSAGLPLVIEAVDSQEHLDSVLADVDRVMSGGLVTMEKVRVLMTPEQKMAHEIFVEVAGSCDRVRGAHAYARRGARLNGRIVRWGAVSKSGH
jgi:hypothetical protein